MESNEENNDQSSSAKTITLRSHQTIQDAQVEAGGGSRHVRAIAHSLRAARGFDPDAAAATIQAAFRQYLNKRAKPDAMAFDAHFRFDDPEVARAATRIQASFRGHLTRKQMEEKRDVRQDSAPERKDDADEVVDIDLNDPEVHKAAVKIQASFKGHMVRKENQKNTPDK